MNRLRQRGFLLNPYRFAGTVQSGAFGADGVGGVTLVGASTATAVASMDGAGTLTGLGSTVQTASGAFSSDGVGAVSLVGASIASSVVSADGAGTGMFASEATALTVDAADFDGTNDYLSRATDFTGAADSKKGILSFWHRGDVNPSVAHVLFAGQTSGALSHIECDWVDGSTYGFGVGQFYYIFGNSDTGPAVALEIRTASSFASGSWRHVLCSWDLATAGARHLYVTDSSSLTVITFVDLLLQHSNSPNWFVGDTSGGRMDGGLAELYFAPGEYLDFSVASNRRKFITSVGKPVNLGATGTLPTGNAPLVYLHLDDLESANNFAINRPGNGNLTVTGALTTYASSPSD